MEDNCETAGARIRPSSPGSAANTHVSGLRRVPRDPRAAGWLRAGGLGRERRYRHPSVRITRPHAKNSRCALPPRIFARSASEAKASNSSHRADCLR